MARHEDEAEEVVPDVFVGGHLEVNALTSPLDVTTDLLVLALERLSAADQIDRLMLRGPHQPGAWLLRHAGDGPLLERCHQGVLRKLFGRCEVADDASQPGHEPGRLDAPDRFDRAVRLGGGRPGYGKGSVTCPRTRGPRGPRRSRRRTEPA